MSDFLITMDNGSQYLAHHGTKGMKWGVWNEETRRKYLGMTSAKGDKLRKKAEEKRLQAEHARSDRAKMLKASTVHTREITEAYAKANAHRIIQQAHQTRADDLKRRADVERRDGNDRKADKFERKSEKMANKAKREEDASKRESSKGRAASRRIERRNIAAREMDAEAAKLDLKAAKLEKKADKADAKQDKKVAKAADRVRETTAELNRLQKLDKKLVSDEGIKNATANRADAIADYLSTTRFKPADDVKAITRSRSVIRRIVAAKHLKADNEANLKAFNAAFDTVSKASISEASVISKRGREAVDLAIEKALGSKRGYRYL